MPTNRIENRQLLYIISMFLIVQFLGLLIASISFSGLTYSNTPSIQTGGAAFYGGVAYVIILILVTATASVILVLIFRFLKPRKGPGSGRLFKLLEIYLVGFTTYVLVLLLVTVAVRGSVYNSLFGTGPAPLAFYLALACALLVVGAKLKWPRLRNVTAIISSVGAGLVFGMLFGLVLSFWIAMIFMALLALYDFIAVFITKHMLTLANVAVNQNLSMMIMANEVVAVPMKSLSGEEKAEYLKFKDEIAARGPLSQAAISNGMVPIPARTGLGTGDLMAPLMLAVSAYTVNFNFTLSLVVVMGSVFGLCLTMYTLKRYKRALPAIPFLLFGILVSLGIFYLATLL